MAELSEVTTAACLLYTKRQLELIEKSTDADDLTAFIISHKFQTILGKINYGSNKDCIQAKSDLNPDNETVNPKQWQVALENTAQGVSAALGIKKWMNRVHNEPRDLPNKVFLTGDQWSKEITKFRLTYAGMNDYNSSDLVIYAGRDGLYEYYYGVSLKKKPKPQSASPTLINNAVSKLLESGTSEKFIQEVDKVRVKYFAKIIRSAEFHNLLMKNKIKIDKKHMKFADEKLLKTKPPGQSKAYIDLKGKNDEIRKWVNKKVASNKNFFYKELKTIFEANTKNSQNMANILAERVLKLSLNEALGDIKELNKYYFGYALVTAIADVNINKMSMTIYDAEVKDGGTVLDTLNTISKGRVREGYKFKFNSLKTEHSTAAKVYFDLKKGPYKIMDLEIRYKGSFTSWPQFLGTLSPEFEKFLKNGTVT